MDENKVAQEAIEAAAEVDQALVAAPVATAGMGFWTDMQSVKTAYKIANMLSSSTLVPQTYKGNPINCMIAMEMTQRTNFPLLMVMQNLYVIQGKPSWSGQFCTAVVNASGRFSPLEFVQLTNEDGSLKGYYAQATRLSNGKLCQGSPVDWDMVKKEGWYDKSGSKWKTMADLMFHYRAAAFFVREHCPDLLCGLQTAEEVQDVKGWEKQKETTVITFD